MITPIEQTPNLAYDANRQQITPVPVVQPQPLAPLDETPVQSADTPQQQQNNPSGKKSGSDLAPEQNEQSVTAQKLRAAWAYLQQLKSQIAQALSGGNAIFAKRIALDAADAASNIETISMQIPLTTSTNSQTNSNTVQATIWLPPSMTDIGSSTPTTSTVTSSTVTTSASVSVSSSTSLIDLAREGLGTAKDVVDSASTIQHYSQADRSLIDLSMQKVLNAMAKVETIASQLASANSSDTGDQSTRIDVNT